MTGPQERAPGGTTFNAGTSPLDRISALHCRCWVRKLSHDPGLFRPCHPSDAQIDLATDPLLQTTRNGQNRRSLVVQHHHLHRKTIQSPHTLSSDPSQNGPSRPLYLTTSAPTASRRRRCPRAQPPARRPWRRRAPRQPCGGNASPGNPVLSRPVPPRVPPPSLVGTATQSGRRRRAEA